MRFNKGIAAYYLLLFFQILSIYPAERIAEGVNPPLTSFNLYIEEFHEAVAATAVLGLFILFLLVRSAKKPQRPKKTIWVVGGLLALQAWWGMPSLLNFPEALTYFWYLKVF